MKHALWITLGIRGNAGDALIYQVTRKLFADSIDLQFRCVNDPVYVRADEALPNNVVIGPGGILVQTNSAKHLHSKLKKQWDQLQNTHFFLWSTGILLEPTEDERVVMQRLFDHTSKVVVRASREKANIMAIAKPTLDVSWAPCASLFSDRLLDVEPSKRDVVVVNFDATLFNEDNVRDHPLLRFKDYAESEGLQVRSMVNASGDSNRYLLDIFPLIDVDQPYFGEILDQELTGNPFFVAFSDALVAHPSLVSRYLNCRFAFGKRLHAWLPFMSFNTPAAFMGMEQRRGMPRDYFGSNEFLCRVPRGNLTQEQLNEVSNQMIGKLNYFIKNEELLNRRIAEYRDALWVTLQDKATEFAEALL